MDIRKNGSKLRKKVSSVLKKLDKSTCDSGCVYGVESPNYQKLRSLKKKMQSLQDECDVGVWKRVKWKRCVDEQDVDVNELGELILQFSETVNDVISVLNEPMDIEESSVATRLEGEE